MSVPESLLLGVLLGVAYSAAGLLSARKAKAITGDSNQVLKVVLGGMLARMAVTLVAFAAIIAFVPVHRGAFVGGLGAAFALGMIAEMSLVLGRSTSTDS